MIFLYAMPDQLAFSKHGLTNNFSSGITCSAREPSLTTRCKAACWRRLTCHAGYAAAKQLKLRLPQ